MFSSVKRRLQRRIAGIVRGEVRQTLSEILPQVLQFHRSPDEERQSYYDHTKNPLQNLDTFAGVKDALLDLGIPVQETDIDIADFERWLETFSEIRKHYAFGGPVAVEKCLQHYLVFRYLRLAADDVYIDVGAEGSPWAAVLNRRGIRSYRLDLTYRSGIHGIDIGADAGDTKLPEGFASALSAQDAFENFIGEDADIRFVRETARILNEKGRYAIVPLYVDTTYFVTVSPYGDLRDVAIDQAAKRVWRDDEYQSVPFSRHYSPEAFKNRIFSNISETMIGKVFYFRNLPDVMRRYPGQRIVSFFMFHCERRSVGQAANPSLGRKGGA
ncbi:MAG: hypothetical protein ACRDGN_05945 [bacterium]